MTDLTLEQRIRRLEDIEEIRKLKSLYSHYANVGEGTGDAKKFADLFTDDCIWDLSQREFRGKAEIIERLDEIEKLNFAGVHFSLNPRIEVNGDEASGEWDLIFPVFPPDGRPLTTVCGYYTDRLRRTADGWRFTYVKYRVSPQFSLA